MKTGKAVLLSVAIVAAGAAVVGGVGYLVYRKAEAHIQPTAAKDPVDTAEPAEKSGTCAKQDENAKAKAILAPAADALQRSERAVARIVLEPLKADDVKLSKVGGRAYWAAGRDYPRDAKGQPMFLLAQINWAEPPKMQGYPERGLLQFFVSGDDYYGAALDQAHGADRMQALAQQTGFRVVYWPDASAPALAPPPASAGKDSLPFDPDKPRRMRFSADHESIGLNDAGLDKVLGGSVHDLVERYSSEHPDDRTSDEALNDELADYLERTGHKLGGYPDFTQSDPRDASDKRMLLFQLDSDDAMMWGDSGIANFFIDPEDLARADFSRVSYHWDCY
ncbi:YwqG family protein [Pseudomonas sp. CGJS7]|uniref:YwqG family protein n=1 Tax=Pseudomonas sp. CGJS7 TaxID=3109348 RepID=UPI00300AEEDF